jgi:hypothetical protein
MDGDAPPLSRRRLKWVWKLFRAWRAETKGQFDRALRLLDEAAEIKPLSAAEHVQRAMLLLRSQRSREAHVAFAKLRDDFKGSDDPDLQYLRHYCTSMLSMLQPGSGQWSYEARRAQLIKCRPYLKHRFRMVTVDEIHDAIRSRS